MNYYELDCEISPLNPWREILVSELSDFAFESFEETDKGLKAYIPEDKFDISIIEQVKNLSTSETFSLVIRHNLIEDQNWNSVWESSFDPIYIDDWCAIIAPFHKATEMEYEIVIEPKMSFGTGHHQTTYMMVQMMREIGMKDKSILDMGTGTGVLAILASKMRCKDVLAIDNEEWAFNNCIENVEINKVKNVSSALGEEDKIEGKNYDVILANINRNALCYLLPTFDKVLRTRGKLLLSGFLNSDLDFMKKEIEKNGFKLLDIKQKDNWLGLCCQKL